MFESLLSPSGYFLFKGATGMANSSPNFSFKALTKLGALVERAVLT